MTLKELYDLKINKNELNKSITYKEFLYKSFFLRIYHISLCDGKGILHELFNMDSEKLKEKYGISMDDIKEISLQGTPRKSNKGFKQYFRKMVYEAQWDYMYSLAQAYYKHYNNLFIPQLFRTKDGYTYDEDGEKLGIWLCTQKKNFNLSNERKERLLKIGAVFEKNTEYNWNQTFEILREICSRDNPLKELNSRSDCDILIDWLLKQEKSKDLSAEQVKKIGLFKPLVDELNNAHWKKMYLLAKIYYDNNGHLKVPKGFRTKDGLTSDEEGYYLDVWLIKQKNNKKLTEEQVDLLNQIDYIWGKSWNKNQIRNICEQYGILFEKNDKILCHISYYELLYKISYLNKLGIPIVDEQGILHEIFSMDSETLYDNYGITFNDLVKVIKGKTLIKIK